MTHEDILKRFVQAYRLGDSVEIDSALADYDYLEQGYKLVEDYAVIPLTKGFEAKVSIKDLPWILERKWYAVEGDQVTARAKFFGKTTNLARSVLNLTVGDRLIADHINRDTLDNRRENLRAVTTMQSAQNRCGWHRKGNTKGSKYKGVYQRENNKWRSVIKFEGKPVHLGTFGSEIEAAKAYDSAVDKYHGEYGVKNNL